jgi:outer membrane immunogenic protein
MHKLSTALLASTALLFGSLSASAADLPARMATKAPAYLPAFNWTGLYIGLHGGYGWGDVGAAGLSIDPKGGFVGGQIGYNWQAAGSPFVLGLEIDSAWATLKWEQSVAFGPLSLSVEDKVNYLGSARVRAGYAWNRALLYATGGLGWAHNEISANAALAGFGAVGASVDNTHFGYTLGGGLEYAFAGPWSVKLEYLYYGLGSKTYGAVDVDLDVQTVKLGVNYRFGAL